MILMHLFSIAKVSQLALFIGMTSRANMLFIFPFKRSTSSAYSVKKKQKTKNKMRSNSNLAAMATKYLITKKGSLCSNHDTFTVNRTLHGTCSKGVVLE